MSNKRMVMTHEYPASLDQIKGSQATLMWATRYKYSMALATINTYHQRYMFSKIKDVLRNWQYEIIW